MIEQLGSSELIKLYQLHLLEGGEKMSFDDFINKTNEDEIFDKYVEKLYDRLKRLENIKRKKLIL